MKQRFFYILFFSLLLAMAFPFDSSGSNRAVDFNYPQDVSKQALQDLDIALKSADGQLTVDALVRYSIAQSGISQDNMPDIVSRIEDVIHKEKQPHIRALLYYFEALVYQQYCNNYTGWRDRKNPVEETPAEISEWDRPMFEIKVKELITKSIEDLSSLKQVPVTSLSGILKYNDLGVTYVPTMQEFMSMIALDMLDGIDIAEPECKMIKDRWLAGTAGDVPAHIYALTHTGQSISLDEYRKYQDSQYSAELLKRVYFTDKNEHYQALKEYVKRFPKSIFTPEISNQITEIESKSVSLSYPAFRSSRDSIPVTMSVQNANQFNIIVYRVPEEAIGRHGLDWSIIETVNKYPVNVQGTIPFNKYHEKTVLPPLPYGMYLLAPDIVVNDKGSRSSDDLREYNILRVTDLAMINVNHKDNKDKVGAVNINSGMPVPGVTINYTDHRDLTGKLGTTGANGMIAIPMGYPDPNDKNSSYVFSGMSFKAIKGADKYSAEMSYYKMDERSYSDYGGNVYTDLGVYRPGETVQWAVIAYYTNNSGRTPLAEVELEVQFKDKNGKGIDTLKVTTDAYGRAEGSFVIPKDRLNGRFSLTVLKPNDQYRPSQIAWKDVNVSEYKTPTFAITFPDARHNYVKGEPVKVTGKAETYSGMPVANTSVRLSLIKKEWSWWWRYSRNKDGEHLMDTTVTTDAQGMFTFSYEPQLFSENASKYSWARHNYQVIATATTDAGETQEESTSFIVGTRRGIELGSVNQNVYINDKPIKLPLEYNTTDEQHPHTYCTWEVYPDDSKEPIATGNLNTADPTIDLTKLPSGRYRLKVHILDAVEGEENADAECHITLYRKTDKVPPVKDSPLWVSPLPAEVDKTNTGHITVGVSVPKAYIYYVAMTTDKVIAEGWFEYTRGLHDLAIPLPKQAGANVSVSFVSYYNTQLHQETARITNPYKAEALKITASSFRDKLSPGDIERWTFTLSDQNGKPHSGAMLLDMYDKAIASIASNNWQWENWYRYRIAAELRAQGINDSRYSQSSWTGRMLDNDKGAQALVPYLYTYDLYPFNTRMGRAYYRASNSMLGAAPMRAKGVELEESEVAFGMMDEKGSEQRDVTRSLKAEAPIEKSAQEQPAVDEKSLDKVVLRENDVKTALWMPMLTSDNKGNINLEFEVPNFNTTWITQAIAWDDKMLGDTWMAEVLTQKPLMVRSSLPRFLRQGDVTQLAATVQNATDMAATCDAVIELFDPRSGDIYATRKFNLTLDPMGSQTVKIDWTVPDTISFAGFRIKAANGRYGDGEQVMVPVLTTISPVIETQPFYIEAAQSHYEATLPQFPKDARVTLEYCDNPVWYCVLALPTIFSDSYCTATQAANSLFALQVAQTVAKSQPQIKEAISYWKAHDEDSTLVSMLQKNQDLKIGTLLASPWVRDADMQTLRMSRLHQLFDDAIAHQEFEKILAALQSLQMADGGFTWFRHPDCKSSLWTTQAVLELIGEVKHLGGLPDDSRLTTIINRAVKYLDSASIDWLKELKKFSANPYANFIGYVYTRNFYADEIPLPKDNADLMKKTLKFMNKNWSKGITLKQKAWYALILNRNGYKKTARNIVESIRQFAIVKPSTGMYWDNLQTGHGWWELDKVAYTCTILQAMNEVDPRQDEIDQVRKWMLLMKQSNDWGSNSLAADAVYTILSTGSQWLERNGLPSITVAGKPINLDKMAEWLGYFRTTLDATTTGDVVIDRTGSGPAWGAIYSQFKSPMTQVQEKAIDEVSISKEYYVYAQDGSLHQASSFKVGDKVKVRVVIKTNKDMDYVTITDERAACFEPVDKLSGYRSEDATWFYLETKDTQTNTFFNSLSKGTHIIGYDVWVTNPGQFTSGIATIQSQYAPQLSAHSAGKTIMVDIK